jgi:hypothetical protein
MGSQHSAQKDCRQGVLPFTRINFIWRLLMRFAWLASPIGDEIAPQEEFA